MRIQLAEGKQRELIKEAKNCFGVTWKNFAEHLQVNLGALKEWRSERCLLPESIFTKLTELFPLYLKQVVDTKPDNWGQILAGSVSPGNRKNIPKPSLSKELSELIGIMLGDGCITAIEHAGAYQIRIAFNPFNEKQYAHFVSELINKVFCIKPRLRISRALYVCIDSKNVALWFKEYGLCWGNKIKAGVGIPGWIKESPEFLSACLRGLIDTDGSVYRLSNKDPRIVRISFKSANIVLLGDVLASLKQLGIKTSKVIYGNIHITAKKDVSKYLKKVGFNNPKNIERLKSIAPWCSEVLRKPSTL